MPYSSHPLSYAQQRLWFLDQLTSGLPLYNIPLVFDLEGALDVETLRRAMEELVRRHEPLRTVFSVDAGIPRQQVLPHERLSLPVEDIAALPDDERATALARLIEHEARQPFDLQTGPILRTNVVRMGPTHHVLVAVVHHISFDGWSSGVFFRELAALYGAFSDGRPSPLPELPMRYVDFAVQQREWLTGETYARQVAYWREQLRPPRPSLEVPTDFPRPAIPTYRGDRAEADVSDAVMTSLQALSRAEGVTLFMTLLAAYGVLLHRLSGRDDIIIGTPIANRTRQDIEPLVGFFANTLALRLDLSGAPTFRDLLTRVRRVAVDAYAHQDLPFERLVEELNPERSLSHMPIVQTFLVLDNPYAVGQVIAAGDVVMRRRRVTTGTAKFDMALSVRRAAAGRHLVLETSADLYTAESGVRMLSDFRCLLEGLAEHADHRLDRLPMWPASHRTQDVVAWNRTAVPVPVDRTLVDLFEARAVLTPDADAVLWGNERLTYAALEARVDRLARTLRRRGVGADDRVGVCFHRSPELVVAVLAVLSAGGAYVPLDPAYPCERLRFIAQDAGCAVVLTEPSLEALASATGVELLVGHGDSHDFAAEDRVPQPVGRPARPESLAYVIYTSGSTGTPKGVAIEHRQVVNLVSWAIATFSTEERAGVLASTSICFDLSVFELFVPLCSGGTVVLVDNLLALPEAPAHTRVTLVNSVPSIVGELLRGHRLPSSVSVVAMAGEPLHPSLVARVYAEPSVTKVFDLYGPTETTVYATCALRTPDGPATIGRPIANTTALVLDSNFQVVPTGVAGELFLGGAGVGRGYLGRDDLTRDRFVDSPAIGVASGRMYRTGDRVRWRADGSLEFLGRLDRQVKVRGFRIELGEIEAVLLDHPGVREAVVLKNEQGPDDARLVAFVVPEETYDEDALYRHLEPRLPHYMLPSTVVRLPALPRLPNGKVDYAALAAPTDPTIDDPVPARTATEEKVAEVWRQVLRVPEVGVEDHFFRIGGHSLLATQVVLRLRSVFGVDLGADTIFRAPTIAALARVIEQRRAAASAPRESWHEAVREGRPVPPPEWSGRAAPYPRDCAVSRLFEQQAHVAPEAPALVGVGGALTYAQLNERANRLARYLRSRLERAAPEAFAHGPVAVGVALERSVDAVIALLAILKAGGAYVPLDPAYPTVRLSALAERARLRCVVTRDGLRSLLATSGLPTILVDSDREAIEAEASANLPEMPSPEALAYILFTSGTTGEPKAVGVPHRAIVRLAYGLPEVPLGPGETVMHLAPLSFDASTFEIWCPLLRGGRVAVAPDGAFTSSALEAFVSAYGVSVMWLTASLFNTLIDDRPDVLAGVRWLLTGGEALSVRHVRRALAALPYLTLINGYGPTETTTFACCHVVDAQGMVDAPSVPIGRPLLNTRVYVLDADGQPVSPGEPGELWIGGDGVAIGYLNDEALTESRFARDPFAEDAAARMYRSGDRARVRPDGALEFLGRFDDQIKIRGFRIEPGDVEAAIARHPAVRRAAVIAAELPFVGRTLVAFVVFAPSLSTAQRTSLLARGLRDDLRTQVPAFMVPARWLALDALPLLATGKIDRRALSLSIPGHDPRAPRPALPEHSDIEERIREICQTVLGVDAIGVDEDFFDLGGHSLMMVQVLSRIHASFRVDLDLRTFFAGPTVAALASAVRRLCTENTSETAPIVPTSRGSHVPLSYAQQRIWFLHHWYADRAVYNVPTALALDGALDLDLLTRALQAIVDRHEALRAMFPVVDGHPIQQVRSVRLSVPVVDLSALAPDAAETEARAQAVAESRRPFDLHTDLLLRATILRVTHTRCVLVLTMHHIVCDGWSLDILFRELQALYAAHGCSDRAGLPPLPIQYSDFAVWQRRYLTGSVLEQQLSYWRQQLRPPLAALDWHLDRPHPVGATARAGRVFFDVPEDVVAAMSRFSAAEGVTRFMTCLAAYQAVIHRYTGQDDICVGTPVANRTRPEIEDVIGCFVNTLVLRGDLSGDPTFRRLVERTRDTAIDAQVHQELPFELLVDALKVRRSASRSPLFQAMLVLQNEAANVALLDGVTVSRIPVPLDHAKFELTLTLRMGADRVQGALEYNADLFDTSIVEGFVQDFTTFLAVVLQAPDCRLSGVPLMNADARRRNPRPPTPLPPAVDTAAAAGGLDVVEIERQLEPLWREVLGLPAVDARDDFFELGGNSLTAVRLFAELDRRFGVTLPLSTLFADGTIAAQARLIASTEERGHAWSPLVPIQRLGTRPAFFLVHGIGGEVLSFGALAQHLGPDQPFFGLRASQHEPDRPVDTVEGVAARYVAALRTRAPRGPYLLGGYSSGGIIAYEMAQQLREAGEDIALLAMVDAPAPQAAAGPLTPHAFWRLVKNAAYWPLDDEFLRSGWAAQRARLSAKIKAVQARRRHERTAAALAAGADIRDLMGLWKVPPRARRFLERFVHMTAAYRPREYGGTVTVFRARTLSLSYRGAADLGWSRLARGGVVVHRVPGAHDTILKEPRVRQLAARLASSLRGATNGVPESPGVHR